MRLPTFRRRAAAEPTAPSGTAEAATAVAGPPPSTETRGAGPPVRTLRWWAPRESRHTPDRACLNCGDPTVGNYCPQCGQRKVDVRISLRRMVMEVLDDQLALNSALPRTLGTLFFRPGRLTADYVHGRIARYIPPFRLYLISSLLFFVLLPVVTDVGAIQADFANTDRADSTAVATGADAAAGAARRDSVRAAGADTTGFGLQVRDGDDGGFQINMGWDRDRVPRWLHPINQRLEESERRLNSLPPDQAIGLLIRAFMDNAPTGVFIMMPVFALLLKVLYFRRKRFYVEHFVFGLHTHALAFLLFALLMVVRQDWLSVAALVYFAVYLFLAMKHFYGQGWIKTFGKYVILSWAYTFVVLAGVGVTVLLTALTV